MDIDSIFESVSLPVKEEVVEAFNVFDFINAINYTKKEFSQEDINKTYVPYIVNKGLSFSPDTCMYANEMNTRPFLDKDVQYRFLINSVRPKKRFNRWVKPKKEEAVEIIKEYYGYNTHKAQQVLSIHTSKQLHYLKQKLEKGGIRK